MAIVQRRKVTPSPAAKTSNRLVLLQMDLLLLLKHLKGVASKRTMTPAKTQRAYSFIGYKTHHVFVCSAEPFASLDRRIKKTMAFH